MKLKLNGIAVECVIGDLPEERVRTQRLRVDVELDVGDAAAETDSLADTVDYAALAERIRAGLADAKCRMIERAAKIVCGICLEDPRVAAVRAAVVKFGAVENLESAEAVYALCR